MADDAPDGRQGEGGGRVVVCPTPIGNLGDVTARVLDALRGADVVACEDTRRTSTLLNAHGIDVPLVPLHEHNEDRRAAALVRRAADGEVVGLVSDAGMPAVADPGRELVRQALAAGVPVEVLPGPSAVVTALVASGLAADRFAFLGFLPRGADPLGRLLDEADGWQMPLVAFESPARLPATLRVLAEREPERPVAVCRELTKRHEEIARGPARELAERFAAPPRGEIVLVLGPAARASAAPEEVREVLGELRAAGLGARQASGVVARLTGLPRRALYDEAQRSTLR
jgi:16S rRNA (cytidine1402-2'-O)-methyltransferase